MNPKPTNVEYVSPYKLIVTFTNGKVKLFDLQPYLHYPVYESLRDENFCRKARVQYQTVVWDEQIDIDPDRLFLESKELNKEQV